MKMMSETDWTERAKLLDTENQMAFLRGIETEILMAELTRRVITQQKIIDTMEREIEKAKRNP